MKKRGTQLNTLRRSEVIYDRFKELTDECRKSGRYNKLYLSSFYVQIADEMFLSESRVSHIIADMKRLEREEK